MNDGLHQEPDSLEKRFDSTLRKLAELYPDICEYAPGIPNPFIPILRKDMFRWNRGPWFTFDELSAAHVQDILRALGIHYILSIDAMTGLYSAKLEMPWGETIEAQDRSVLLDYMAQYILIEAVRHLSSRKRKP